MLNKINQTQMIEAGILNKHYMKRIIFDVIGLDVLTLQRNPFDSGKAYLRFFKPEDEPNALYTKNNHGIKLDYSENLNNYKIVKKQRK